MTNNNKKEIKPANIKANNIINKADLKVLQDNKKSLNELEFIKYKQSLKAGVIFKQEVGNALKEYNEQRKAFKVLEY